jgi:hypothetical protein
MRYPAAKLTGLTRRDVALEHSGGPGISVHQPERRVGVELGSAIRQTDRRLLARRVRHQLVAGLLGVHVEVEAGERDVGSDLGSELIAQAQLDPALGHLTRVDVRQHHRPAPVGQGGEPRRSPDRGAGDRTGPSGTRRSVYRPSGPVTVLWPVLCTVTETLASGECSSARVTVPVTVLVPCAAAVRGTSQPARAKQRSRAYFSVTDEGYGIPVSLPRGLGRA